MKVGGSQIPPTFQFEVIKMIDENLTMAFFGYHSFDWVERSSKYVIVICDKCGIARETKKYNSYRLCKSCSIIGRKHTNKTKEKISKSNKGNKISKEHKEKISLLFKGKPQSKELIEKRTKSLTGRKLTEETKKKIQKTHLGKKLSEEHKKKISISHIITHKLRILNGEKHPLWKEGKIKYPEEFDISLRRSVRYKYNNCDFFSGLHKNIISPHRELSVHHIDYNKNNCDIDNLIPLTISNHARTNVIRWFWEKLIKNTQEIDRWYYEH